MSAGRCSSLPRSAMEEAFCSWLRRSKAHPKRGLESQRSETGSESVFCGSLLAIVVANSESVRPPRLMSDAIGVSQWSHRSVHCDTSSVSLRKRLGGTSSLRGAPMCAFTNMAAHSAGMISLQGAFLGSGATVQVLAAAST
jgi:hypothetical protein